MSSEVTAFTAGFGSRTVVDVYTALLVPRLFTPWAEALVDRLRPAPGSTALDVACGPGTVTRVLARRIGPAGRVTGVDLSDQMVATARTHAAGPGAAPIDYVASPATSLPAADGSVDAATCQQGLQFFPDPEAAAVELRRILRVGGSLAVACWAQIERCAPWDAISKALAGILPPERVALVGRPFSWPGAARLEEVLTAAGFADVVVVEETRTVTFEEGLPQLAALTSTLPIAVDVDALDDAARAAWLAALRREAEPLLTADGAVRTPMVSLVATARG